MSKKVISRDEVLGGLGGRPARQANTTMTLIENRTAHLRTEAFVPAGYGLTETGTGASSQAYLEGDRHGPGAPNTAVYSRPRTVCRTMGDSGPPKSAGTGHAGPAL